MALAHVCIRVMWCAIHDICAKAECERRSPSMIQRVRSAMRWMHTLSLSSPFAPSNPTHIDAQLSHKSGARRRIAVRSSSPSQQRLEIQKNALDRRSRGKHPCSKARQWDSQILLGRIESQHCLSVRCVGVTSPHVQCSNTGLKMRNKK